MKRIILTGGGTAGHVTPNIALVPKLKEKGYDIQYIGSYDGIERKLIEDLKIPYYGIASGKLRRYFDIKNFSDPFRVIKGYGQAVRLMKKLKPSVVFSKGGFVAVPVVMAAKHCHIPVVIHESDLTPGLANKLSIPSATKVCCNFPETISHIPDGKAVLTGSPIRQELLKGNRLKALDFCGFTADKPVLLVIGGSQGSVIVNDSIRGILPELLKTFQVIHLCGKGKLDPTLNYMDGYVQYEYIKDELADLEQRLKILKDVHQALQKHAKRLSELSPIGNYSDAENLGDLMDTMKDIIENIHKTMEQYIRKTNQSLEGIK